MVRRIRPQTSSMWIVSIAGQEFQFLNDFRFTSFSGIKDETNTFQYTSPFLHRQFQIPSFRRFQPVTLSMPYNVEEHSQLFKRWNDYENTPLQIRIEPITGCTTSGEELSRGYAHDLSGAIWIGCESVNVDRNEANISKVILKFTFTHSEEIEL